MKDYMKEGQGSKGKVGERQSHITHIDHFDLCNFTQSLLERFYAVSLLAPFSAPAGPYPCCKHNRDGMHYLWGI
jgi:hypothetical protein